MGKESKFDGTPLSGAHISPELSKFFANLDTGAMKASEGTQLADILDGTPLKVDGAKLGFYGKTPAAQLADVGALTDNSTGAVDGTLGPVGATNGGDESGAINANFADLAAKVNAIRDALRALGLMA